MNKNFRIYFTLFFFAFILSCTGQKTTSPENIPIEHFDIAIAEVDPYFKESMAVTSAYGLSSITRNIIQDKMGHYWFATWEGIMHYDGDVFTNYTNKEGLRRFRVFTILEDRTGDIWFGTVGGGVYHYDGKSFINVTMKDGLISDQIGCIVEDAIGNIWIGTQEGVSKYDGKSFVNFTTKEGLSNNDVNSIVEDQTGKIWFGTRGDACYYDGSTFTNFTNGNGVSFANTRSIIEDQNGNIWLGGNDGLWRYDGSDFMNIVTDFVGCIYEDTEGVIWICAAGSSNGNSNKWVLSRYDQSLLPYESSTMTQVKTEETMFFGIMEDKSNNIWLGSLKGVYRYDGSFFEDFKSD